ncbi:mitochondrial complex I, 17.2 kd subunit [Spathaspora passalidarum NRRL Y-27907]|uniref:Mitochondrial complex I, 17.2 kd subunit n=1 Tax=Spathaspora passalidarum (strain NRRL Y-27907 / 11-Y1) TaxID=619300 RepID=G3APR2_SPAPN|nr:mitochondrial complex I, 17.2 kd subunit [Spathaspora passalidarum NRRL Y-27907]EGW32233.1 mitochondrial complex I, 17.2 kd subunit [Spathaspora passalidarum NRRL Y-27907]
MDPIKSKYSLYKRLLHKFQARRDIPFRRKFFIGYDLHGNTYWEFTIDGQVNNLRRKLEPYRKQFFEADYFKTIPPQWLQWLRRTRNVPPTLEELLQDEYRQARIKMLAQQADQKWIAEKERLVRDQAVRLANELDRVKRESGKIDEPIQEKIEANLEEKVDPKNPWLQADNADSNPIASAHIKPRK